MEEEIVCYADKFHSKGHSRFNSYKESLDEMVKINSDFGVIMERFRNKFGIPDIKELEKKYKKWHEEINEWVNRILL